MNKSAGALLSAPVKGYSGACPFLRGLSTVSELSVGQSQSQSQSHGQSQSQSQAKARAKEAELFCAPCTRDQQSCAPGPHQQAGWQARRAAQPHTVCGRASAPACELAPQAPPRLADRAPPAEPLPVQECGERPEELASGQQQSGEQNLEKFAQIEPEKEDKSENCGKKQDSTQSEEAARSQMKLYDYRHQFERLIQRKKDDQSYRVFRRVRRFSSSFPHGTEQERPVTIWCSNDYFGMSSHPRVRQAIRRALDEFGAGSGGTRNIAGNSPLHEQLEFELAQLHEKEAALLFSSCYVANDSSLYTLLTLLPNCVVFSDAGNHASMIQGIRNSGAKRHIFKTFDAQDLEAKLKLEPPEVPKIVAFETVHSMTGDISEVEQLCDIAHHYGAITFVDEVHAVGLYGDRGAGIGQRDNCMHKIDIVSGTLGKAYGNCGGYVAASAQIIDVIRSYAAGFIFTTSLPPTVVCGALESVRILKGEEGRYLRQLQQANVFHMKRALTAAGLPHYHGKSHIIPIPVGNAAKCSQLMDDLLERGHYIQSINYPTVPRGTERLRVSLTPFHSEQMIDSLIETLVPVWQKNNLDFLPPVELPNQCRRHQMQNSAADTQVGQSLWCHLCHKEMNLCSKMPRERENLVA